MLHLHALVWLRGNIAFTTLRDRLREDSNFADRMIRYLDSVIMHGIHVSAAADVGVNLPNVPPSSKEQETDDEFLARLDQDSNVVASTKQRHSKNHMATCFKYSRRGTGKNACRFGMPRDLAQSMNLASSINVGTMPGSIHGIQLLPVAFDQIMTSRGYQRSLSRCRSFTTSLTTQQRMTSLPNRCWRRLRY